MSLSLNKEFSEKVLQLMKNVSDDIILPAFKAMDPSKIMIKEDSSLVTVTDQQAEVALTSGLKNIFHANVLGEEGYEENPAIGDFLEKEDEYCWIIDPIDGTSNFTSGNNQFGIIIALVKNKKILGGWIYQSTEGKAFYALKGKGVYDQHHKKIERQITNPEHFSGYPHEFYFQNTTTEKEINALSRARTTQLESLHSTAIEYMDMVTGKIDFIINNHYKPWDHAAGQLIVSELGLGGGSVYLGTQEGYSIQKESWACSRGEKVLITYVDKKTKDKVLSFF